MNYVVPIVMLTIVAIVTCVATLSVFGVVAKREMRRMFFLGVDVGMSLTNRPERMATGEWVGRN